MLEFMTFAEGIPARLIYSILRRGIVYIWNAKNILTQKKFLVNGMLMLVQKYYSGFFKILWFPEIIS